MKMKRKGVLRLEVGDEKWKIVELVWSRKIIRLLILFYHSDYGTG